MYNKFMGGVRLTIFQIHTTYVMNIDQIIKRTRHPKILEIIATVIGSPALSKSQFPARIVSTEIDIKLCNTHLL